MGLPKLGPLVWRDGEKAFWVEGLLRVSDWAQSKGGSPPVGTELEKQAGGGRWCSGSELSGVSGTRGTCHICLPEWVHVKAWWL